jgi:hypothetical protein
MEQTEKKGIGKGWIIVAVALIFALILLAFVLMKGDKPVVDDNSIGGQGIVGDLQIDKSISSSIFDDNDNIDLGEMT